MATVVKGVNAFSLTRQRQRWTTERGWMVERTYEGPVALLDTQIDALIAAGATDLSVDRREPASVSAQFPEATAGSGTATPDVDPDLYAVWELIANPMPKDLRSFGAWNESESNAAALEKIEQAIRDGSAYTTDWNDAYSGFSYDKYRALRLLGTDSYMRAAFAIRKTFSTTARSSVERAQLSAGTVQGYAQVIAGAGVLWAQPAIREYDNTSGWENIQIDEWLKMHPIIRHSRLTGKSDITIEWLGDAKWSATLYDGGTAQP